MKKKKGSRNGWPAYLIVVNTWAMIHVPYYNNNNYYIPMKIKSRMSHLKLHDSACVHKCKV